MEKIVRNPLKQSHSPCIPRPLAVATPCPDSASWFLVLAQGTAAVSWDAPTIILLRTVNLRGNILMSYS